MHVQNWVFWYIRLLNGDEMERQAVFDLRERQYKLELEWKDKHTAECISMG